MNKIKAVIIGTAHMHVNEIAEYILGQPDFVLAGVADVPADVPEKVASRYTRAWNLNNVCKMAGLIPEDDYISMLEKIMPDIVFVLTENHKKLDVAKNCIKHGVDLCVEKPMALNAAEAAEMKKLADEAGVGLYVNWPTSWRAYLHAMKAAVDSDAVGRPVRLRYLNGHTGPLGIGAQHRGVSATAEDMTINQMAATWWYQKKAGGGVFLDILCYGCMFGQWFIPEKAEGIRALGMNLNTRFADIADNAAALIRYPGSMADIEATWTMPRKLIPAGPVIICEKGVIYCEEENGSIIAKAADLMGKDIALPNFEMPSWRRNFPWEYAHCRQTGDSFHQTLDAAANIEVMALLDAAEISVQSGKEEKPASF